MPRDFWLLFGAEGASTLGTSIGFLALQLLLIDGMHATADEVGLVRAAQWAPYLVIGLLAGVWVDRVRRKPVLVGADLAQAALVVTIAAAALAGRLSVWGLAGLVFGMGAVSCVQIAAHQSFIPRVVSEGQLPDAFARLGQLGGATQSAGPLVAGTLVKWLSAPVALLLDAASYLISAAALSRVRVEEPVDGAAGESVWAELREGARWVYTHPVLRSYAWWLHGMFFFMAMVQAMVVYLATVELGLGAVAVGLVLAAAGVGGVVAGHFAADLGRRYGVGLSCRVAELTTPAWGLLIAVAPPGGWGFACLLLAHLLVGVTVVSATMSMSYRNEVTPDHLRARMNGTIRTFNWGGLALASLLSGWLAARFGVHTPLWIGAAGLVVVTAYLWVSPFGRVVSADPPDTQSLV